MMKTTIKVAILFFILVVFSCNKEYTNPYDRACPSILWTPTKLITTFNHNAITVSWDENETVLDGFVLEKGSDSLTWTSTSSGLIDKTFRTYTDTIFTPGSTVFYRISAKADLNKSGISYAKGLKLPAFQPTVTTTAISNILATSATGGGTISANGGAEVTARGVCWSINQNPTILNNFTKDVSTSSGSFVSAITGLSPGTIYYVRAYATNSIGTAYGNLVTVSTAISTATMTTSDISNVLSTSASGGGTITSNGGITLSASGVCWSTTQNPTILNSHTTDGSITGTFISVISGLSPGTVYYVRAYATNSVGTAYGNQITITTLAGMPTVTSTSISNVLSISASGGGTISSNGGADVTKSGVCWSTSQDPTILNSFSTDGSATGTYISTINNLSPITIYYVRAYATNSVGTAYGNQITFTTVAGLPTITTTSISNVLSTSASAGGTISLNGGTAVTKSGVCWSTNQDPTVLNSFTTDGSSTGTFTSTITNLTPLTIYYVRAYATNSVGTAYGNQIAFTTIAGLPTITTTSHSNVLTSSASSGGTISANGGAEVIASGVCWSTSQNPTILNSFSNDGLASGTFTSTLIGLSPGTLYYVRAYATNATGTSYGNQVTLTTTASLSNLITKPVTVITITTASGGGTITSNGGSTVTASGVCWSTSQNPTILNSYSTDDGSATGSFTSAITGLSPGTVFYVRAYATNAAGTSYGNQVTFITAAALSIITTAPVTGINFTSSLSGGTITSNGGAVVTISGVCWSTSQNPTILNSYSIDGTATGAFISAITGLSPGTTYYVRAYATNIAGTSYGNQVTFTTSQ